MAIEMSGTKPGIQDHFECEGNNTFWYNLRYINVNCRTERVGWHQILEGFNLYIAGVEEESK